MNCTTRKPKTNCKICSYWGSGRARPTEFFKGILKVNHWHFLNFQHLGSRRGHERKDLLQFQLQKLLAEAEQINILWNVLLCDFLFNTKIALSSVFFKAAPRMLSYLPLLLISLCSTVVSLPNRKLWWKLPSDLWLRRSSLWFCNWRVRLSCWEERKFLPGRCLFCYIVSN